MKKVIFHKVKTKMDYKGLIKLKVALGTVPIAKILSGKNACAWVSMDFT